jgi:hypothetical protein
VASTNRVGSGGSLRPWLIGFLRRNDPPEEDSPSLPDIHAKQAPADFIRPLLERVMHFG